MVLTDYRKRTLARTEATRITPQERVHTSSSLFIHEIVIGLTCARKTARRRRTCRRRPEDIVAVRGDRICTVNSGINDVYFTFIVVTSDNG